MKITVQKDLKGLKEMHTRVMQVVPQGDYEVYCLRQSIVEVTNLREGGDVRGSA